MSYFYGIFGFVLRQIFFAVNNYGLALIIFTFLTRLLMFPASIGQQKNTAKTQRMQTKIKKIQQQYAGDQRKIQEETQALYSREGHNPLNAGCLPMVVQLPIIYGLIGVIYRPLTYVLQISETHVTALTDALGKLMELSTRNARTVQLLVFDHLDELAGSVPADVYEKIAGFNFTFMGFELGKVPSYREFNVLWLIPILSFLSSFASSLFMYFKQKQTNPEMAKNPTMGCMTFGMPLFSLFLAFQFPAGIGMYWIASNLFAFLQTVILNFTYNPKKMIARILVEETIQRRSKEENLKRISKIKS
ncbi:MAG: YidC/Oxa1 family membrane protein insertase [Oscillospiraceae bacterium]|nr:YidC/Oxa1 family membrane protein insertase [Oscillospiraceae bacterium]